MYISLWENYRGHPDNISFMQFSTKIDGFEQKDSQGFENSYNSYEQYPLEKFFIFTIYQNYTLALSLSFIRKYSSSRSPKNFFLPKPRTHGTRINLMAYYSVSTASNIASFSCVILSIVFVVVAIM